MGLCFACNGAVGGTTTLRDSGTTARDGGGRDMDGGRARDSGPARDGGARTDARPAVSCGGSDAYLHGDLWPMWYNMRVACDPEHRALWRCQRLHGADAPDCAPIATIYAECTSTWASPWPCLNWGVCAPVDEGNECGTDVPSKCDTRSFDYDSPELWGKYYGLTWSSPDLHRFLTIHVRNGAGDLIAAYSARPGSGDAHMDGVENFGVGPAPSGHIQLISSERPGRTEDRFGSFACIRLPAGQPLTLWAAWMNTDFPHTCAASYHSQPYTPCSMEVAAMTFEAGRHYLWTDRGLEEMEGCAGPPSEIAARLPAATCDTSAP